MGQRCRCSIRPVLIGLIRLLLPAAVIACSPTSRKIEKPIIQDEQVEPPPDFSGNWTWSHRSKKSDIEIDQSEKWTFETNSKKISGEIVRVVQATSLTVPFTCNGGLSYKLKATYKIRGTLEGKNLRLSEYSYKASPHPCEPDSRPMSSYEGRLEGSKLRVSRSGDVQTLTRAQTTSNTSPSIKGTWQWRTKETNGGVSRQEIETWSINSDTGGTYQRNVTLMRQQPFACSNANKKTWSESYAFSVSANGVVTETKSTIGIGNCAPSSLILQQGRIAQVTASTITILWDGGYTQVLNRIRQQPDS